MNKFTLLLVLISLNNSLAQEVETIHDEIDQKLWKPFKAAFEGLDGQALNALYADEVLRVTPKGIDTENEFKEANLKRFEKNRVTQTDIRLDFWFDSRHTNATTSYEVGFYKMMLTNKESENIIYGQFHIVLKKIDGIWKITQDWDSTRVKGARITSEDFERQNPIEFK